jgi:hypothetical protein
VFVVCCVGSGLCDEVITRTEKSYQVFVCVYVCVCVCVCVCARVCLIACVLETTTIRRPKLGLACCATENYSELLVTRSESEGRRNNSVSEKHIHMCF